MTTRSMIWSKLAGESVLRRSAVENLPLVAEVVKLRTGKPISDEIGYGKLSSAARLIAGTALVAGLLAISTLSGCDNADGPTGLPLTKKLQKVKTDPDPYSRAVKLFRLIPKFEGVNDSRGVEKCLSLAVDASEEVFDKTKRATIFARLARAQVSRNKKNPAAKSLNKAEQAAAKIESVGDRIGAMASIAAGYKEIDETYGVKYAAKAETLLDKIESVSEHARLSGNIAKAYQALGRADEATRMIEAMEAEVARLSDAFKKATALITIARVYNAVGDKASAWKQCKAANSEAAKIKIPGTHAIVLCDIALTAKAAGHKKDALKMVARAKELAEDSDQSPEYQDAALEKWRKTKRKLGK